MRVHPLLRHYPHLLTSHPWRVTVGCHPPHFGDGWGVTPIPLRFRPHSLPVPLVFAVAVTVEEEGSSPALPRGCRRPPKEVGSPTTRSVLCSRCGVAPWG